MNIKVLFETYMGGGKGRGVGGGGGGSTHLGVLFSQINVSC